MARAKVGLVTPVWGDGWDEDRHLVRSIAGALASEAELDVLVAGSAQPASSRDGPFDVRHYAGAPARRGLDVDLLDAVTGLPPAGRLRCECGRLIAREAATRLPQSVQDELLLGDGTVSAELLEHLEDAGYEALVFAGYRYGSTVYGGRRAPAGVRTALIPLLRHGELELSLRLVVETLAWFDAFIVASDGERCLLRRSLGAAAGERNVARVHPPFRPDSLVDEAGSFPDRADDVVLARVGPDVGASIAELAGCAGALASAGLRLLAVGCGTGEMSRGGLHVHEATSEIDLWRRVAGASAFLDPTPQRVSGRDVLGALACGTPVLVRADGGAAREYAERASGGLWYVTGRDLAAAGRALGEREARDALGRQGRSYAFGLPDTDAFVETVVATVLGRSDRARSRARRRRREAIVPLDIPSAATAEECERLVELARGHDVLELGSWQGRSTVAMASVARIVHSVDPHMDTTLDLFLANLERYDVRDAVVVHVARSTEMLPLMALGSFDLVFVDAMHQFEAVTKDLELSLPLLRDGGVIAAHDYGMPGVWHHGEWEPFGVTEAVDALAERLGRTVEVVGTLAVIRL